MARGTLSVPQPQRSGPGMFVCKSKLVCKSRPMCKSERISLLLP